MLTNVWESIGGGNIWGIQFENSRFEAITHSLTTRRCYRIYRKYHTVGWFDYGINNYLPYIHIYIHLDTCLPHVYIHIVAKKQQLFTIHTYLYTFIYIFTPCIHTYCGKKTTTIYHTMSRWYQPPVNVKQQYLYFWCFKLLLNGIIYGFCICIWNVK